LKFIYGWLGLPHLPGRAVPGNPSLKTKKKASELAGFGNTALPGTCARGKCAPVQVSGKAKWIFKTLS
jgi:hypothetical protein